MNNSLISILLFGSAYNDFNKKTVDVFDIPCGNKLLIGIVLILDFNSVYVRPLQGVFPVSISKKITPMDHISLL